VLASGNFGTWLEDAQFMTAMLRSLGGLPDAPAGTGASATARPVSVLAVIVSGLPPSHVFGDPSNGFSILHGELEQLMPDLWQPVGLKIPRSPRSRDAELQSSIGFVLGQGPKWPAPVEVTIPLANTTFINNRQSTLLAMQWDRAANDGYRTAGVVEKQTQRVLLNTEAAGPDAASISQGFHADLTIPLVPVTPPRLVLAGWENIVRQIELDGKPVPASQELEDIVHTIFAQQQKTYEEGEIKTIPVWALVIPPKAIGIRRRAVEMAKEATSLLSGGPSEGLQRLAERAVSSDWLADGCRLHRVCA
jgi:hypothetical protein